MVLLYMVLHGSHQYTPVMLAYQHHGSVMGKESIHPGWPSHLPRPGVRSTFFKSLSVATELAELEGCRPSLHCQPPQKGPGRPWSCHIPETGAWAYPINVGPPKRYKLVNITPSNYGYNYHKTQTWNCSYVHQLNAIDWGAHIVGLKVGLVPSQFQKVGWEVATNCRVDWDLAQVESPRCCDPSLYNIQNIRQSSNPPWTFFTRYVLFMHWHTMTYCFPINI